MATEYRNRIVTRFSGRSIVLALLLCRATPLLVAQEGGWIHGRVIDPSGVPVYGAVVLVEGAAATRYTTATDAAGVFRISSLPPGPYKIRISASAFSDWTASDIRAVTVPDAEPIAAVLEVAPQVSTVTVGVPPDEVAAEQVHHQLQQRALVVLPNFFVSYESHPAPLPAKQKARLSFRLLIDPATIFAAAATAGVQQAKNSYWEWGQGAQGYGKRFAATYGTAAQNLIITSVVAASLLHQDPRYFYSGRGSVARRAGYALAAAFRTKGDNGNWQPPYSTLIGTIISAEISNTYYPDPRTQVSLLGRSIGFRFVGIMATNLAQEFLLRKLTSHKHELQSAATIVLREGIPVRLLALQDFSGEPARQEEQPVQFILAEDLIVNGAVLAKAGHIATGQMVRAGDTPSVLLENMVLRAGNVDVPLRSSQARTGVGKLEYRQLPESGKIELTLFVARDVEFPQDPGSTPR